MKSNKEKKPKVIKAPVVQTIFCIVSFIFVIGCFGFYGNRLVKYYKVYNPKSETGEVLANLSSKITSSSSIVYDGDGLYMVNGNYIYKGSDVNNYILISNMLFRIVKINGDKTIDLVLDDYINKLEYNETLVNYKESSINKYLNDKVLSILDKDLLNEVSICSDTVSKLSEVNCNIIENDSFIRLLGITDFLNSINEEDSYLVKDDESIWLYNTNDEGVWHTNGMNVSNSEPNNLYAIKPVITIKNTSIYVSGDGSLNNPYQIKENDEIAVGTYLDINDEIFVVYEEGEDYYKIQSDFLLKDKQIFDKNSNEYSESSLKAYLDSYVDTLSYKDLLKEVNFNDIESKIGLLSQDDLKFNSSLTDYFLIDKLDKNISLYNSNVLSSKVSSKHNIRIGLGIKKDFKTISGNGSRLAPFIVEV